MDNIFTINENNIWVFFSAYEEKNNTKSDKGW